MFAIAILAATPPAALAALAVAAFAVLAGPRLLLLGMARLLRLDWCLVLLLDDDFVFGLFRLDIGRQAAHFDEALRLFGQCTAEDGKVLRADRGVGLDDDGQRRNALRVQRSCRACG